MNGKLLKATRMAFALQSLHKYFENQNEWVKLKNDFKITFGSKNDEKTSFCPWWQNELFPDKKKIFWKLFLF